MTPALLLALLGAYLLGAATVAWAYRCVLRAVLVEAQDREAALRAELYEWRRKHNERALRSGRGAIFAVPATGGRDASN